MSIDFEEIREEQRFTLEQERFDRISRFMDRAEQFMDRAEQFINRQPGSIPMGDNMNQQPGTLTREYYQEYARLLELERDFQTAMNTWQAQEDAYRTARAKLEGNGEIQHCKA